MTDATELNEAAVRERDRCVVARVGNPDDDPLLRAEIDRRWLLATLDEIRAEVARWQYVSAPVTLDQIEDMAATNVELNERALAAESALAAVEALAKVQAISCRAQHRADHERNWLDVLAIIAPVLPAPTSPERSEP